MFTFNPKNRFMKEEKNLNLNMMEALSTIQNLETSHAKI